MCQLVLLLIIIITLIVIIIIIISGISSRSSSINKKIKTSQFIENYRDCDKEKANTKTFNIIELFTNSIYEIISMLNLFL